MNPVYICEQGATVRQKSRTLYVEKQGEKLIQWPVIKIERLCLFGRVQLTTQAVELLLDSGIDVAFFSISGRLRGRLAAAESKNVLLRLSQYERYLDEAFQLQLVRMIVQAKLKNARALLKKYGRNHPACDLASEERTLEQTLDRLPEQKTVAALRGCEGVAAAAYFRGFGKLFRTEWTFEQRSRRPPKDPVNALLSLGYTMLTNEMTGLLTAHGFDPYIGFLHGIVYGRPSLALDMIEEFRHPIIDRLTLKLFNKRIFQTADFEQDEERGILLKEASLKKYFGQYETWMRAREDQNKSYREVMRRQVQRLSAAIRQRRGYHPYVIEQ